MTLFLNILYRAVLGTLATAIFLGVAMVAYLEANLESVEVLKDVQLQVPLRVYTGDGKFIGEFGEYRRTPVELSKVPKDLINAVLATEDRRFYEHYGVDLRGILRAVYFLVTKGTREQGGSTITMQVARNFFLTREKNFVRKLNEILLALKIEQELTKEEILGLYLNRVYFGKRAYGVQAASEVYYGTTVDHLTLAQMAMIAGLPQAPTRINPLHDPEAALKRRKHVLDRMLAYGYITQEQFDEANNQPLSAKYHGRPVEIDAPYMAEMVRQELYNQYGEDVYALGFEVYTTLNSEYQVAANQALRRGLREYDQRHGYRGPIKKWDVKEKEILAQTDHWVDALKDIPKYADLVPGLVFQTGGQKVDVLLQDGQKIEIPRKNLNWSGAGVRVGYVIYAYPGEEAWHLGQMPDASAALVALNPDTGAITGIVGGFDYAKSNFNRASQAERQPGSSFKPFIYAAALSEGFTLSSIINDAPFVYVDPVTGVAWRPRNNTRRFNGPMRLRPSLTQSQNVIAVRLLQAIGVPKMIEFAKNFGFNSDKLPPFLSLALGTASVTPLEMAAGYCVFPNGGYRVKPYFIETIRDYQGKLVYQAPPPERELTISPQIAYLMVSLLQDVVKRGTARRALSLGREDLAGKTGTTNDKLDAWYSGFNRDIVATAWVGFDDPRTLREYGSQAALPMWMYFMEKVLKDKPEHAPEQPEGMVTARIDPYTGLLAGDGQSNAIYELFIENQLPAKKSYASDYGYEQAYDEESLERDGYYNYDDDGDMMPESLF